MIKHDIITEFCDKILREDSQVQMQCKLKKNHTGKCDPYPFLKSLKKTHLKIADKIIQDAYHTRGNKTKPYKNRSYRWDRPISPSEASTLKNKENLGIPKKEYALQNTCVNLARKLTRLIYEMKDAPTCPEDVVVYFDRIPDKENNPCLCPLCLEPVFVEDFEGNEWGKAKVELWHLAPLSEQTIMHTPDNIAWGHRTCNIAQQERTTEETLEWMITILKKHGRI